MEVDLTPGRMRLSLDEVRLGRNREGSPDPCAVVVHEKLQIAGSAVVGVLPGILDPSTRQS